MTTTHDDIDFSGSYGADAAQQAAKSLGGGSSRWTWFGLKDKETVIGRFLTDAFPDVEMLDAGQPPRWLPWITVDQHAMVPTKPKPSDWPDGANYPATMGCVCRKDKAFKRKYGDDCYVCDKMRKSDGKPYQPTPRQWALICLREEVVGTPEMVTAGQITQAEVGKVLGVRDKTREIKKTDSNGKQTDEVEVVKDIQVVNLGYKNFFSILQGFAGRYGTVLDRDYAITRQGTDQSTIYQIVPLDPIQMADGRRFDLRDAEFMARYLGPESDIDLRKIVADRASDDFFNRFFVVGAPSSAPSGGAAPGPAAPVAPQAEPDEDRLAALRDRVKAGVSGDAAPAPQAETPAQPAPEAPAPAPAATGGMRDFG